MGLHGLISLLSLFILAASAGAPPLGGVDAMKPDGETSLKQKSSFWEADRWVPQGKPLPNGAWGGKHIFMEVSADGTRIEFDCAHATFSKILLDSRGRFAVTGVYVEERGGPTRQDDEESKKVLLNGSVSNKIMKLTVTLTATKELIGTFTLTHGAESEIVKCR
jgi:hypothetical protein